MICAAPGPQLKETVPAGGSQPGLGRRCL